eukprot:gene15252-21334_t
MSLAMRSMQPAFVSAKASACVPRPLPLALTRRLVNPIGAVRLAAAPDAASAAAPVAALEEVYVPAPGGPGSLMELTKDTYYQYLEENKDTLVIVDCYTDWCGPCKLIYPELVKLAEERTDIKIVKFNCNKYNKDLGVKLKIRVAPTFLLYMNGEMVDTMTGAKVEKLKEKIEDALNQPTFIVSSGEEEEIPKNRHPHRRIVVLNASEALTQSYILNPGEEGQRSN